jgi:branched-subunit amino acid aminotransferase/4-amino-4-deoxychorismate lyase
VFETVRLEDGRVRLWDQHLLRLRRAGARGRHLTAARALVDVHRAATRGGGSVVLRIDVDPREGVAVRARATPPAAAWSLALVPGYAPGEAAREEKRADRAWLVGPERAAAAAGADEPLLVATGPDGAVDDGARVGETARASLFLVDATGRVRTPPVDGLLPGVTRAWALGAAGALEAPLTVADVRAARAAFCTNAVRGVVPVREVDGRALARDPLIGELATAWQRLR